MSSENENNSKSFPKKTTYNDIYEVFEGEFVHIVTRSLKGSETRGSTRYVGPVVIEGFLIGHTENFFLLSKDGDSISDGIRKDDVVRIFIPEQELMEMLSGGMEKPDKSDMS